MPFVFAAFFFAPLGVIGVDQKSSRRQVSKKTGWSEDVPETKHPLFEYPARENDPDDPDFDPDEICPEGYYWNDETARCMKIESRVQEARWEAIKSKLRRKKT